MHIDVTVALEMSDDRHPRFLLHALDQTAPAARHQHVDASFMPASM